MKKSTPYFRYVFVLIITLFCNCVSVAQSNCDCKTNTSKPFVFARGADVSWLPQMETTGYTFYDADGAPKDALQLLKDRGMNTSRLRVFVNPSSHRIYGHCSPAETFVMAVRAKNMGMRIIIDFIIAMHLLILHIKPNLLHGLITLLHNYKATFTTTLLMF